MGKAFDSILIFTYACLFWVEFQYIASSNFSVRSTEVEKPNFKVWEVQ